MIKLIAAIGIIAMISSCNLDNSPLHIGSFRAKQNTGDFFLEIDESHMYFSFKENGEFSRYPYSLVNEDRIQYTVSTYREGQPCIHDTLNWSIVSIDRNKMEVQMSGMPEVKIFEKQNQSFEASKHVFQHSDAGKCD